MAELRSKFDSFEAARPNGVYIRQPAAVDLHHHFEYKFLAELVVNEKLLDAVEEVLGPDLVLLSATWFCKYPELKEKGVDESFIGWHQVKMAFDILVC